MLSELMNEKKFLENIKASNHDDRLVLIANKKPTMKLGERGYIPPLNLKEGWKAERCIDLNRDKDGNPILVNYYSKSLYLCPIEEIKQFKNDMESFYKKKIDLPDLKKEWSESNPQPTYIEKSEYETFTEEKKALCHPIYEKAIILSDGIKVISKRNFMYLNLTCLPETLKSRYRLSLEQMKDLTDKGVLNYKGKATNPKAIMEAVRYHLYLKWKVKSYEHNIFFVGKLGKVIFDDLKAGAKETYPTTIYLKTGKRAQIWIKYYNVTAKKENRIRNRETDLYKFEMTFQKPFFKANGMEDIRKFIEMPDIQEMLSEWIHGKFKMVLCKLKKETKAMLKREYRVKNERELILAMLSRERTLTNIEKRLAWIDKEATKIKKTI